ncbi:MAG: hypothetical protein CMP59_02630 [Flavobacteriales bacterium]|nr:hypothetical protein [Flavobacteriales bacterium]|tara:strand:- start:614 stop:886 length:273 start_codon:yes stop_codon:yes gene_type:complete
MSNTRSLKLIDGTYDASDAAEILYTVLNDKIKFHSIQLNSCLERNQGEVSHSESRLKQLREEKEKIAEILSDAKNGKKVKLRASIDVDIE